MWVDRVMNATGECKNMQHRCNKYANSSKYCDLLTRRNIVPIHLFNTLYYSDITCNDLYWPGGKKWTCDFSHPVVGEKCKVQIKKHKIILKVKKKDSGVWKDLMVGIKDTKRRCWLSKTPNPPFYSFKKLFDSFHHWSILINHYKY